MSATAFQPETLRRVLEHLTTAVVLCDAWDRVAYLNPAAEGLLGASARQAAGARAAVLLGEGPAALLARARAEGPFTERELRLEPPGAGPFTADLTVSPLAEPEAAGWVLAELIQVDRQRRILREEHLLAQHQAARALVRGLAHEIKNPLGGLRGAAQLLERELADPALREYTQVIIGEADRLQALVDRLLGPSGLPRRRAVNVHEVLERVRTLVEAEAPPGVRILRDYDPSIPEAQADPDQLIQALLNLVRNAVQAVSGGGTVTLRTRAVRQTTIGARRHKLALRIDVVDDGPGIPPALLERIFLPMVSGRKGGTGLGLPIAQDLVRQHGGLIECSSRPGRTEFTVLLPLNGGQEAEPSGARVSR